jgi:hypothetical protein
MTLEEVSQALQAIPALVEAVEKLTIEVRGLKDQTERRPGAYVQSARGSRHTTRQQRSSKKAAEEPEEEYVSRQGLRELVDAAG